MKNRLFKIILTLCLVFSSVLISNKETNAATFDDAVISLKQGLKNRENSITVTCETTEENEDAVINNLINESLKHTKNSIEGDYIKLHLMSGLAGRVISKNAENDIYKYEIKFSPRYLSTYNQEQELTSKLDDFYNTLDLNNMSNYDKLKSIYDYICDNVEYGFMNNSAYSALINGQSSCRGYALLFYRMALDLGFDARIIPGRVVGGNYDNYHEWNIVKVGNKYYNVDANFGDNIGQARDIYFLQGTNSIFKDGYGSLVPPHVRDLAYDTEEFNSLYPMSEKAYNKKDESEVTTEKPEETTTEQEAATEETTEAATEEKEEIEKEILVGKGSFIIKGPTKKLKKFTSVISKIFGSLWR